jgi:hypothetical protein
MSAATITLQNCYFLFICPRRGRYSHLAHESGIRKSEKGAQSAFSITIA